MPMPVGSTSHAISSGNARMDKDSLPTTSQPTSSSTRRAPALAWHLGLAISLTIVLIVINAGYSPSRPTVIDVATATYDSLAEASTTYGSLAEQEQERSLENGKKITGAKVQQPSIEQEEEEEEEEEDEEEVSTKAGLGVRPEVVVKPAAPEPDRTCPDGSKGPKFTSLRVVDDITQEADVELIADIHRAPQFTEVPQPIMTDRYDQKELCKSYRWKYCTDLGGEDADRSKLFYTCEVRDFVAKVHCAYIDGRQTVFGGIVYDHNRRFPVHAAHPGDTSLDANSHYDRVVRFKSLSHNLAVYPFATAHTFERLPRLFLLIKTLPSDVPLLVADTPLVRSFFDALDKHKVFPKDRLVYWDPNKIYYADTVYFAGEMGMVPKGAPGDRNNSHWDSLRVEHCSWAISMPRWLMQESMQSVFWEADRSSGLRVLVVHRRDAGSRMVDNHGEMMDVLKKRLPSGVIFTEFVGSEHDVESTLRLFANADVLIAPHGAAITFTAVMRPGRAVIEIGYDGRSGMMWPGNYFHTMVVGSDLVYYATLADGEYGSSMHVNVEDVAKLANMAVQHVQALPKDWGHSQATADKL